MMPFLPPLRLTGAEILRDGQMQRRSVALADGRITRGPLPGVDLSGYLILPGLIDLHGDEVVGNVAQGLARIDRAAAVHGITTPHVAQSWSWEGGARGPDHAEAVMAGLESYRGRAMCDLRLHIRAETHLVDQGARLLAAVRRFGVGYVVFNDRLDEAARQHRADPAGFTRRAEAAGLTSEGLLAQIETARANKRAVPRHLCTLAEGFDAMGVSYGSHADPDGETREVFAMIGARIAAFPPNRRVAAAAHAMMTPVVVGAEEVLGGGVAAGLIGEGLCDAIASAGTMAQMTAAVWALVDGGMGLAQAWAMISVKPAEILRLPDRGRLDVGLRADLVIVNAQTRAVEATICGGRLVSATGEAAVRFAHYAQPMRMAAE